ncbi:hypothetical protein VM98_34680, partial [Streptomyces rubellomurinus subsp. indigoferus]
EPLKRGEDFTVLATLFRLPGEADVTAGTTGRAGRAKAFPARSGAATGTVLVTGAGGTLARGVGPLACHCWRLDAGRGHATAPQRRALGQRRGVELCGHPRLVRAGPPVARALVDGVDAERVT